MTTDVEALLNIIEQKMGWGESAGWQTRDFENLSDEIMEVTGISLSTSTLRRIWGRVEYRSLPSNTTLDALSKFAGYDSWRAFLQQSKQQAEKIKPAATDEAAAINEEEPKKTVPWGKILLYAAAGILLCIISIAALKKTAKPVTAGEYQFSFKPVTRDIPNSVIFSYDASASTTDSVFIQQSWDTRLTAAVSKNDHLHTSVYYEPGFFQAKLIVGKDVVKSQSLLVPTSGWLGMIANSPVPVYLKSNEFIFENGMHFAANDLLKKTVSPQSVAPYVKYYNVGNFDPVAVSGFSFDAQVRNEFGEGAAVCQHSFVSLVTDDGPIMIPLSAKGCISEISVYCIDHGVSGKTADLSGFGVDFSHWVNVSCKSADGKIQFYINGTMAYSCVIPKKEIHIVGMAFIFEGTGAVQHISLGDNSKIVFKAF